MQKNFNIKVETILAFLNWELKDWNWRNFWCFLIVGSCIFIFLWVVLDIKFVNNLTILISSGTDFELNNNTFGENHV